MSGTSENELKKLIKSIGCEKGFLGTFDCRFPGFIRKDVPQTAIVNTGPREKGGVHWIALAWDNIAYKIYLFDPLGWKDSQLKKYYDFSYKNIVARSALNTPYRCVTLTKNSEAVQCTCSGACGLYCILFIYCFNKFKDPFNNFLFEKFFGSKPSLRPINPSLLHDNQYMLYNFLKEKSHYFMNNEIYFICQTNLGLIKTHS